MERIRSSPLFSCGASELCGEMLMRQTLSAIIVQTYDQRSGSEQLFWKRCRRRTAAMAQVELSAPVGIEWNKQPAR